MRKLLALLLLLPLGALAQSIPALPQALLPLSGTEVVPIVQQGVTRQVAIGNIPLAPLPIIIGNSVLGNSTVAPTNGFALAMPNCSGSLNALTWISGNGFSCNTITSTATPGGLNLAVQYNNNGVLGGVTPLANAVLITDGTGAPMLATTLPAGITIPGAVFTNPNIGTATGTSLALGGCTITGFTFCTTGNASIGGNLAVSGSISGGGITALFSSPPPIGNVAANTGAFTTLSASSVSAGYVQQNGSVNIWSALGNANTGGVALPAVLGAGFGFGSNHSNGNAEDNFVYSTLSGYGMEFDSYDGTTFTQRVRLDASGNSYLLTGATTIMGQLSAITPSSIAIQYSSGNAQIVAFGGTASTYSPIFVTQQHSDGSGGRNVAFFDTAGNTTLSGNLTCGPSCTIAPSSGDIVLAPPASIVFQTVPFPTYIMSSTNSLGADLKDWGWALDGGGNMYFAAFNDAVSNHTPAWAIGRGTTFNILNQVWSTSTTAGTAVQGMSLTPTAFTVGDGTHTSLVVSSPGANNWVDYFQLVGGVSGAGPGLYASGETNTPLTISTSGTASLGFRTGSGSRQQFAVIDNPSGACYPEVSSGATSGLVATNGVCDLLLAPTSSNVFVQSNLTVGATLKLQTSGTSAFFDNLAAGSINFRTNGSVSAAQQFAVLNTGPGTDYPTATSGSTSGLMSSNAGAMTYSAVGNVILLPGSGSSLVLQGNNAMNALAVGTGGADFATIAGGAATVTYGTNAGNVSFGSTGGTTTLSDASITLSALTASSPLCLNGSKIITNTCTGIVPLPNLSATSASLGGSALLAGQCSTNTTTVTGATTSMVALADPVTDPGTGAYWDAFVSSSNTVTTKVCATIALTPSASAYNIRVLQ